MNTEPQFEVGYEYCPGKTSWNEWVDLNFRKRQLDSAGVLELRLFQKNLTPSLIRSIRDGEAVFALAKIEDVCFFLFRFDGFCGETAFHWSFTPEEDRADLPPIGSDLYGKMFITLINADTGIVEAIRYVELARSFALATYNVLRKQMEEDINQLSYLEGINDICKHYPTFEAMFATVRNACIIEPKAFKKKCTR